MSNFVLGYSDVSNSATYSGGTWETGLDTDMLNRELVTAAARTTTTANLELSIVLSETQDNEVIGLVNHNLTTIGTWRVRAYAEVGHTTLLYDSGLITVGSYNPDLNNKTCLNVCDTSYTTPYWLISISDATNSDGYLKLGSIFIGKKYANSLSGQNMDYGLSLNIDVSNNVIQSSTAGVESYIDNPLRREYNFSTSLQDNTISDEYFLMGLRQGNSKKVIFELDSTQFKEGIHTMIARMTNATSLQTQYYNLNKSNFIIMEII